MDRLLRTDSVIQRPKQTNIRSNIISDFLEAVVTVLLAVQCFLLLIITMSVTMISYQR
jgi:hypothetical protein